MLQLAVLFLILALVAGILGYGGLMVNFAGLAQIVFIVLFLISAVVSAMRGRPPL
jgi:uncharacterized membrane protein YtjA (UPF0391 family)